MSRVIPTSFYKDNNIVEKKEEEKPKRRSSKEIAIERNQKRISTLKTFCIKYKIEYTSDLCKIIRKIFRNPSSKNIPIAEYKKELDAIGNAITYNEFTIEEITKILQNNCDKGYKYLIYEGQLTKNKNNSKKIKSKDNISINQQKNTKQVTLEDFDDYRQYLKNPDSDKELLDFVHNKLGVNV